MGGTIALLAREGHRVTILDLTDGEPTPFGDPVTRAAEAREAALALSPPGGEPITRVNAGLPNRRVEHTVEARHRVAGVIRAVQARVMFVPYFEDAHPDHVAGTRISEDARFDAKLTKVEMPVPAGFEAIGPPIYPTWLFYYYATHLRVVPSPTFLVDISSTAGAKQRAIGAYRSQFERNPANRGLPARLAEQDAYFGSRIGVAAAEPFFAREPLGLTGLSGLANLGGAGR